MKIRQAIKADASEISALISALAHFCTSRPDGVGAEKFLKTIEPGSIAQCITSPDFQYFAAFEGPTLVGVVATKENKHLFHLFVGASFQRCGLARQLWAHAKENAGTAGNTDGFTVNSSVYAEPVYERFGFITSGPRIEKNGIAFVPMAASRPPSIAPRK